MTKTFRARLRAREVLFGTMVTLPSPSSAEILAHAGFDWLFIDGEHGPLGSNDLLAILQAVGNQAACLVRVPKVDEEPIKKVLDMGASGIIVPQVNTAEQAEAIIQFAKYSPLGSRGVGLGRAHGYGMKFGEYLESANEETVVVVQAEHATAVENIESIVKVQGIDAILIGPYDLSSSYGKLGQIHDPTVTAAIKHVTEVCRQVKMPLGYFGVSAADVRPYMDMGYNLLVAGVDTLFLGSSAQRTLRELNDNANS